MKFGFDADTLDAVWIFNRNILRLNLVWFFTGFLFTLSMPLAIYWLIKKDVYYILFISDLYFCLLSWIVTYAALIGTINRKSTSGSLIKQLLNDLSLTRINRSKFLIGMVGFESIHITYSLLPYIIGYFAVRFTIILSGITGIYTHLDLIVNLGWLFTYPILAFSWIYILRMLWSILTSIKMKAYVIAVIYISILITCFIDKFFHIGDDFVNYILLSITDVDFSKGFHYLIISLVKSTNLSVSNVVYSDTYYTSINLATIYLLLTNIFWMVRKCSRQNKARIEYLKVIGYLGFIYLFFNQIITYISYQNVKLAYFFISITYIIERIGFILIFSIVSIMNLSLSAFSFTVPMNIITNLKMHKYFTPQTSFLLLNYSDFFHNNTSHIALLPEKNIYNNVWGGYYESVNGFNFSSMLLLQIASVISTILICLLLNRVAVLLLNQRTSREK